MVRMDCPDVCPLCGTASTVRRKLVLIDEKWVPAEDKDCRLFYFSDIRMDDIRDELLTSGPLGQFLDALFCDRCHKAFVSEHALQGDRWRDRWT